VKHDEAGVCIHCQNYEKQAKVDWDGLEREFKTLAESYRGKGEKYDFLVPLTGGKDSSYVLYYMTKVCKARVLAFTWDNGLIREAAWENIRNVVEATGVDHQVFRFFDDSIMRKLYAATFKSFGKMCFCPLYMMLSTLPAALEQKIPLIIVGFSEGQREMDHSFKMPSDESYKEKLIQYHRDWKDFFTMAVQENHLEPAQEILDSLLGPLGKYATEDSDIAWPKYVPLANYVNWMKMDELEQTLAKAINYKRAASTTTHTSCIIEPVKGYLEYKRGLNEMASEISCFVRNGTISRDEGIREAESMGIADRLPDNVDVFNTHLGLTMAEFEEYSVKKRMVPPAMESWVVAFRARLESTLPFLMGIEQGSAKYV
jgi:3'-phosphoadenosine 5'-phosphosulfate sulfotransferase (PAPS reductase)/FAD synthetase